MAQFDFSGKTVLVAGGSTGIGNAAARGFLASGATVHVTGTRESAADYAGTDGSIDGLGYHQLDFANGAAIDFLAASLPSVDILVIAGAKVFYQRREFNPAVFADAIATNLTGPMHLASAFRAQLARTGQGALVFIGSVASFRGTIGQPAYSASKGGLLTLTKTLAQAFARDGIRVNLVAPGMIRTKMTEISWADPARADAIASQIPLGRLGEPEDLSGPILFLASDSARYVTGASLIVDGGLSS